LKCIPETEANIRTVGCIFIFNSY